MAFATHFPPAAGMGSLISPKYRLLAVTAAGIAVLCGTAAFLFLVLRDNGRTKVMVNEQLSPSLQPRLGSVAGKTSHVAGVPATGSPSQAVGQAALSGSGVKYPFKASKSQRVSVGPVKLRLTASDAVAKTYDVNVSVGRRTFAHRHIKVNQPLWITVNRGVNAFGMVALAMDNESITGYWTQINRAPQVSSRGRGKHP